MAQYESRVVTTKHKEFVLALPTDYIEVEKLMAGIRQSIASRSDTPFIEVTATDEELIFSYEVHKQIDH